MQHLNQGKLVMSHFGYSCSLVNHCAPLEGQFQYYFKVGMQTGTQETIHDSSCGQPSDGRQFSLQALIIMGENS